MSCVPPVSSCCGHDCRCSSVDSTWPRRRRWLAGTASTPTTCSIWWPGWSRSRSCFPRTRAVDRRPTPDRAMALAYAGYGWLRLGEARRGRVMLAEAVALVDRLDDRSARAGVLHVLGAAALLDQPPDLDRARRLVEQS